MGIAREANDYYDHGDYEACLDLANRVWSPDLDADIQDGAADVFFFTRTLAWRSREDKNARPNWPDGWKEAVAQRELWHARALTAAVLTDARHTVARLQLQRAFVLMELGAYAEARSVLDEMLRLVGPDHELRPIFMRLREDKTAYSFFAEGRYGDAVARYTSALEFCDNDPRGALKVQGGLALSRYLGRLGADDEYGDLVAWMRRIRDEADAAGYKDVAGDASCNLKMMEVGEYDGWCPFELL